MVYVVILVITVEHHLINDNPERFTFTAVYYVMHGPQARDTKQSHVVLKPLRASICYSRRVFL